MKILLVDDSKLIRVTLKKKLAQIGYNDITEAENVDDALAKLSDHELVLTDMEMPGADGTVLLEKIRARQDTATLPVVLITGQDMTPEQQQQYLEQGFSGIADKTLEAEQLQKHIDGALKRVKEQRQRFSHNMVSRHKPETITLAGFNNLTKCLSFNLYDFFICRSEEQRLEYVKYIDRKYSSAKIAEIAQGICDIIEAQVLDISKQDYDPHGASTLVLMSDIKAPNSPPTATGSAVHAHLNKSHICAHTYPDTASKSGICSFRVDIDIATCGEINPLHALNYMFGQFESDVVIMDYVVRGYTRDIHGRKVYNDDPFNSIRDFVKPEILKQYQLFEDLNIPPANIWQTKLLTLDLKLDDYFMTPEDLAQPDSAELIEQLRKEMREIYYMHQV